MINIGQVFYIVTKINIACFYSWDKVTNKWYIHYHPLCPPPLSLSDLMGRFNPNPLRTAAIIYLSTTSVVCVGLPQTICESLIRSKWLGNANKGANLDEIETKFFQLTTPFLATEQSTFSLNLIPRVTYCVCTLAVLPPQVSLRPSLVESMFAHQEKPVSGKVEISLRDNAEGATLDW